MLDMIFNGDCLELFRKLPNESVDVVVSSPPYNIGKSYEAREALETYLHRQTQVLGECARVLKPTGSIFWQVGAFSDKKGALIPLDIKFFPILEGLGLIPKNRIIWVRPHGLHSRRKFSCRHETILWFAKTENHKFFLDPIRVPQKYQNKKHFKGERKGELSCNPKGKNVADLWAFRNVKHNHEEQTIHPCQFPEDMVARMVLATTEVGDTVLDPYMGAGTVAVVARDHGRHFLGAELDPTYCEVAERRLSGLPDDKGSFANLKCLRRYIQKTGESADKYRFDVQVGSRATLASKIYPEEHHMEEIERRAAYEEDAFSARVRGEPEPEDYFSGGKR